jgi:hypothetical protein
MSKSKATLAAEAAEREDACKTLREIFPVGSTVTTSRVHLSRSGMYHVIAVLVGSADGSVRDVSHLVASAIGSKYDVRGGVAVGGAGMDMGYHIVYGLSRALYADGFGCTGVKDWTTDERGARTRCPSNDHVNSGPERDNYTPGHLHSDPGYALQHRWV